MRLLGALKSDIRFQFKQGFYSVYIFMTLVYTLIIMQIPEKIHSIVVPIIVFSDPSVLGFFFIGGIVMLEKEQGILQYMVVTPLRSKEYLFSKVISLAVLGEAAGIAITLIIYKQRVNWPVLVAGILLSSIFFTLYGFMASAGCRTMNEYFIKMVPYMIVIVLPCIGLIGFKYSFVFNLFPSAAGLKLVMGAFQNIGLFEAILYIALLIAADVLMFIKVDKIFNDRIVYGGE